MSGSGELQRPTDPDYAFISASGDAVRRGKSDEGFGEGYAIWGDAAPVLWKYVRQRCSNKDDDVGSGDIGMADSGGRNICISVPEERDG